MKTLLTFLLFLSLYSSAQIISEKQFTRADSLRGGQAPERTAYDINFYHLNLYVDPYKKYISGENLFRFTAIRSFSRLQFDLFENMKIEKVIFKGQELPYYREFNAVFIDFPEVITKDDTEEFTVVYSGYPIVASNAPWDGGFVFSKDSAGAPWVGVAVQGVGASLWWPNKDQQADKVDSMLISVAVPDPLMNVSNGQFKGKQKLGDGYTRYDWFVSYPINPYNVTLNIANYAHLPSEEFIGEGGVLKIDYYVLPENRERAKQHFSENVPAMLNCFEHWFGPYPFYRDGYKLIESAYLGMEHQSAIAYGNRYENGYLGHDNSKSGYGKDWDFIIIHESGHEWFGNSITSKDIADSWIHEGFTTYSEALFVECKHGKEAADAYLIGLRSSIQNKLPIIGTFGVDDRSPTDVYYKGANVLQTVRSVINNDKKWRGILRGLNLKFSLKTITTKDVVDYINEESGINFTSVFNAYLLYPEIPVLEIRQNNGETEYRWNSKEKNFDLPIKVKSSNLSDWQILFPTSYWKKLKNDGKFIVDTKTMYFNVKRL
jgi:aminopeptidase N